MNAASHHTASGVATLTIAVPDEAGTHALAASLARQCRPGDCILLSGDLGAGKTAFARGFIQSLLSIKEDIVSPTFTLVQTYRTQHDTTVWHFDLYRLHKSEEIAEIGLDEALDGGITLIEWPELVRASLPKSALDVTIQSGPTPGQRVFGFAGLPAAWQDRLHVMKESSL